MSKKDAEIIQNSTQTNKSEMMVERYFQVVSYSILIGLAIPPLFALQSSGVQEYFSILAVSLLLAGACVASGGFFGLLFGIPRSLQRTTQPSSDLTEFENSQDVARTKKYIGNTSLEEISDWLTKIIVGVGLTSLYKVPSLLKKSSDYLAPRLGGFESSSSFALSTTIFFTLAGFFLVYLWSRLYLLKPIRDAEKEEQSTIPLKEKSLIVTENALFKAKIGEDAMLDEGQLKALYTIWRLQALHHSDLSRLVTFSLKSPSSEYPSFLVSVGKLLSSSLIEESPEGQYNLTGLGLRYCADNYKKFPAKYWYQDQNVTPEMIDALVKTVNEKLPK